MILRKWVGCRRTQEVLHDIVNPALRPSRASSIVATLLAQELPKKRRALTRCVGTVTSSKAFTVCVLERKHARIQIWAFYLTTDPARAASARGRLDVRELVQTAVCNTSIPLALATRAIVLFFVFLRTSRIVCHESFAGGPRDVGAVRAERAS